MEGKLRQTHLRMQEHLTSYMHNVYVSSIKRKNTQICHLVELYTYCSMNKQYKQELPKEKSLISKSR